MPRRLRSRSSAVFLGLCFLALTRGAPLQAAGAAGRAVNLPTPTFVRHVVSLGPYDQVTKSVAVGDVNDDGKPDIVVAGADYVVWYQNPGVSDADWAPTLIATSAPGAFSLIRGYGEGASVVVRDVNGDGRMDVITGEVAGPDLTRTEVWFENTTTGWVRHVLSSASYCHDLVFGDLNGDGTTNEAMCDDEIHKQVSILRPSSDRTAPWMTTVVDPLRDAMGSSIADIDRDGRLDIVAGRAWYRNPGPSGAWTRYPYTTMQPAVTHPEAGTFDDYERIAVLDLNGDGRLDIVASMFTDTPEGKLYAFLAPANPLSGSWTSVQIDPGPLFSVHSIAATADFDGSGRIQILVAEMNVGGWDFGVNPHPHSYIYRLDGPAGSPSSWTRFTVDNYGMHEANPPQMVDVNGDGRTDIVSGQENFNLYDPPRTGEVDWWENTTSSPPIAPPPPENTDPPTVTGTAQQGQTLTANNGSWSGASTAFMDQWRRCDTGGANCLDIAGATSVTYAPLAADVGSTIRLAVTADNPSGATTTSSPATSVVIAIPIVVGPIGSPGGSASGGGSGAGGGTVAFGASSESADTGPTAEPVPTAIPSPLPIQTPAASGTDSRRRLRELTLATVSGTPRVRNSLRGKPPTWNVAPTRVSYRWQICTVRKCVAIKGATKPVLTLISAEAGHRVRLAIVDTIADKTIESYSRTLTVRK